MVTGLLSFLPIMLIFPLLDPIRMQSLVALVAGLPLGVQIALAFLTQEFLIYWGHRLSHEIPALWQFHSVHHSSEHLDWLAGERRHPVDGALMGFFVGVPLMFLGFDIVDLLWLGVFNSLWDMTIHANLGWRLKFMRGLWVTTEYHHWHHVVDKDIRNRNYAGALPIFDWLPIFCQEINLHADTGSILRCLIRISGNSYSRFVDTALRYFARSSSYLQNGVLLLCKHHRKPDREGTSALRACWLPRMLVPRRQKHTYCCHLESSLIVDHFRFKNALRACGEAQRT